MGWLFSNPILIQSILIYSVLAISVQVSLRAGVFSLAGVGCWGIGAYGLAICDLRGWGALAGIAAGVAAAGLVSYLLSVILVRLRGLYLAMSTIAFNQMVIILLINGGPLTGAEMGLFGIESQISTFAALGVVVALAILLTLLERGTVGRTFDTIRENEELAMSAGVDTARYRRFAFVLSGMIGALGGAMHVMMLGMTTPDVVDFSVIVSALTMVIIGGFHSWRGALIGAALVQAAPIVLQSLGAGWIGKWWDAIYGALIVVVAVFAPLGLLGAVQALWRLVAGMAGAASANSAGVRRLISVSEPDRK